MILVCSLDVKFQNVNKTSGISMILVCSLDVQFQNVYKTYGITMILVCQPISQWANASIRQSANQPNRDPVVRDQKVLPEVRNRPLLPRDFSAIQPTNFFPNPVGEAPVLHIQRPIYI